MDGKGFGPIVAKMILDRFPELRALSEAEKMQLAEELYGAALQELPHLSEDEIQAELERSMDEYRRDPGIGQRLAAGEGPHPGAASCCLMSSGRGVPKASSSTSSPSSTAASVCSTWWKGGGLLSPAFSLSL
jgi:hypothetical protein